MLTSQYMHSACFFFSLLLLPPPRSTLFPYTTLFRSIGEVAVSEIGEFGVIELGLERSRRRPCIHLFANTIGTSENAHRSEEHTSELQSRGHLVCRLLLEKKKNTHTK